MSQENSDIPFSVGSVEVGGGDPMKTRVFFMNNLGKRKAKRWQVLEDQINAGLTEHPKVKVIDIDDQGKVRLSRRAAFDKSSETSGTGEDGSPTADYPFRTQRRSGPPQRRPSERPRYGDNR